MEQLFSVDLLVNLYNFPTFDAAGSVCLSNELSWTPPWLALLSCTDMNLKWNYFKGKFSAVLFRFQICQFKVLVQPLKSGGDELSELDVTALFAAQATRSKYVSLVQVTLKLLLFSWFLVLDGSLDVAPNICCVTKGH